MKGKGFIILIIYAYTKVGCPEPYSGAIENPR